jgi:hypothetical protein
VRAGSQTTKVFHKHKTLSGKEFVQRIFLSLPVAIVNFVFYEFAREQGIGKQATPPQERVKSQMARAIIKILPILHYPVTLEVCLLDITRTRYESYYYFYS